MTDPSASTAIPQTPSQEALDPRLQRIRCLYPPTPGTIFDASTSGSPCPYYTLRTYVIERILHEGDLAWVLLAYDQLFHRRVALKILEKHMIDADVTGTAGIRFAREREKLMKLECPTIVQILDSDSLPGEDGRPRDFYLALEYVEGGSLADEIKSRQLDFRRFSVSEIATIAESALQGLQALHKEGIVHRDLKPGNVLLVKEGDGSGPPLRPCRLCGTRTRGNRPGGR